jgi:hypothetical protein
MVGAYSLHNALLVTRNDAGPVRGVHFHPSRPLLATGGDDYKVKVECVQPIQCFYVADAQQIYDRKTGAASSRSMDTWTMSGQSCFITRCPGLYD